jgi:hypothetical protein
MHTQTDIPLHAPAALEIIGCAGDIKIHCGAPRQRARLEAAAERERHCGVAYLDADAMAPHGRAATLSRLPREHPLS